MFCGNCGNKLDNTAKFCGKCGASQQRNNSNSFHFTFNSMSQGKAQIDINGSTLTITRPGLISKFSHGFSGSKSIMIKQITGVQIKNVGLASGYIQFIIAGHEERQSGIIKGAKDENIVYSDSWGSSKDAETNKAFDTIKKIIEEKNDSSTGGSTTIINNNSSKYDDLQKIKKLLDDGILSEDEYNSEKQKILNT